MRIAHFVPRINYGGGTQSIISEAVYQRKQGINCHHQIISIEKNIALELVRNAVLNDIRTHICPDKEELDS